MSKRKRDRRASKSAAARHGGNPLRMNQRRNALTPIDTAFAAIEAEREGRP